MVPALLMLLESVHLTVLTKAVSGMDVCIYVQTGGYLWVSGSICKGPRKEAAQKTSEQNWYIWVRRPGATSAVGSCPQIIHKYKCCCCRGKRYGGRYESQACSGDGSDGLRPVGAI
jgi:hypothetical protein